MKNDFFLIVVGLAVVLLAGCVLINRPDKTVAAPMHGNELIVCGWDEVSILDPDARTNGLPKKVWSWRAAGRRDLPVEYYTLFQTTSECKPVDHGRKILIVASDGAVAYVDRQQDRVLFYVKTLHAHSAELLPGNRIAVALSKTARDGGGCIQVFDLARPGQAALCSAPLSWAHGVIWDETRQVLWTLGEKYIRSFKLADWNTDKPKLDVVSNTRLPDVDGHDLYPVPDSSCLFVTTARHVWLFDRDTAVFHPYPALADKANVKGVCQHPLTKQLVYVQAEGNDWWAENLHFLAPDDTLHISGEHFYKARWIVGVK